MTHKPKFNLLDAFIILIILAAIAAGAYMMLKPEPAETSTATSATATAKAKAEYVVELTRVNHTVSEEFQKAFDRKESLTCGETERFASTIKSITITPAKRTIINHETKTADKVEDPQSFDVKLTLETDVIESETAITAEKTELRVGNGLAIKGSRCSGYGYITGLTLK